MHEIAFYLIPGMAIGAFIGILALAFFMGARPRRHVNWYDAKFLPIDYEESDHRIHVLVADSLGYIYEDTFNTSTLTYEGTDDQSLIRYFAYIEEFHDTLPGGRIAYHTIAHP